MYIASVKLLFGRAFSIEERRRGGEVLERRLVGLKYCAIHFMFE